MIKAFLGSKDKYKNVAGCYADIDGFAGVMVRVSEKSIEVVDELVVCDRRELKISKLAETLGIFTVKNDCQIIAGNETAKIVYDKTQALTAEWETTEFNLDKISFLLQSHLNEGHLRFTKELVDTWQKEFATFSLQKAKEGIFSRRMFALFHVLCDLEIEDCWLKYL